MDANLLLAKVHPIFDSYQRASSGRRSSVLMEDHVAEVYQALQELASESGSHEKEEELTCLSDVLLHFFDCVIAMDYNNDSKDAIDAIFELVAYVASEHALLVQEQLTRAVECSAVLLERVRSSACRYIGVQASCLVRKNSKIEHQDRAALLDQASQALVPRFTDKAQSVRLACINAAKLFFEASPLEASREDSEESDHEEDDPDLREALQWALQHDPSVTNRVAAIEALPATVQTSDLIISRIRDVKQKVRIAAVEKLTRMKMSQLDSEQAAAIVETACSERCPFTKDKIISLVSAGWMKDVKFDVIPLLKHVDVVTHEETCEKLIKLLVGVNKEKLAETLSEVDYRSYWEELESAVAGLRSSKRVLDLTRLFYTRVYCQHLCDTQVDAQKEALLDPILPDIPTLSEHFERHSAALMKVILDLEQTLIEQNEEEIVCICLNLLQLFEMVDMEEGARAHIKSTMKRMLASLITPEDLVEGCVKALRWVVLDRETEFWKMAMEVLEEIQSADCPTGAEESRQLRICSIVSIVCEISSSNLAREQQVTQDFCSIVSPNLSHDDEVVQEASVACLGRLGLFANSTMMKDTLLPQMIEIASNEEGQMANRAQAILALADWTRFHSDTVAVATDCLSQLIPSLIQHEDIRVACMSAEVALKLLFSRTVVDSEWLGRLLFLFFDPRLETDGEGEDEEDLSEVGNPERLQQMLSVFFPAYCLLDASTSEAFASGVSILLALCSRQKRKRGTKALPIARILEYVTATAANAEEERRNILAKDGKRVVEGAGNDDDEMCAGSDPSLLIALQLSTFVLTKHGECTVTFLRAVCKFLGKMDLVLDNGDYGQITQLFENMELLEGELNDATSLRSIENLAEEISRYEPQENDKTESRDKENQQDIDDRGGENTKKVEEKAEPLLQQLANQLDSQDNVY